MSNGDGKNSVKFSSEKENQLSNRKKKKLVTDEFVQAIARIAVAQVCESVGFQSFQQSALDCLADVGVRYIREIGKIACSYANLSNRSQCNVFDLIQSLEDLNSIQGFLGSSDVSRSLSGSGVFRDIVRYVGEAEEIPFAYLIPVFPVSKERKSNPGITEAEETNPHSHIPGWLPKFPDPVTYADLTCGNDFETVFVNKIPYAEEQHKRVERPLRSLQQKLLYNGSEAGVTANRINAADEKYTAEINPFLASPLSFSEKVVSLPLLPAKLVDEEVRDHKKRDVIEHHHLNLVQSLQANEAMQDGIYETEDRGKILLNGRPSIQFKFKSSKKLPQKVTSIQNDGVGEISIWFGNDYEAKDKS